MENKCIFLVCVLILTFWCKRGTQQITECTAGDKIGEQSLGDKNAIDTGTAGDGYMLAGVPGDCCGVADTWNGKFDVPDNTTVTVWFQIWRPTTGTSYELIAEQVMAVSANGEDQINADRSTVKSGDLIGWWSTDNNIIMHKNVGGSNDNFYLPLADLTIGAVINWGAANDNNGRTYALRLDVVANSAPVFSNLPATQSVVNSAPVGTYLFTLTITDADPDDLAGLIVTANTSSYFSFDTSSYIFNISTHADTTITEIIEIEAVDQCQHTSTGTLTLVITNEPPVIHGVPSARDISEDSTAETLLFTVNVTDSVSIPTCAFAASVPATYPFTVRQIANTTDFGIYVQSNPGFNYSVQNSYLLDVDCTDGDLTDTGRYNVYLIKNQPPTFVNLQNSTTMTTTVALGVNVFTVLVSDPEGDGLTFTMTCNPASCPFSIFASGAIQVSSDLTGHTTIGYDLSITVSDGKNSVGPKILTITFSDINDPVTITNLPLTAAMSVQENTPIGTSLYTVSFSDVDNQTHAFTMTSAPGTGLTYFAIDPTTGVISTIGSLNYEALSALGTTSFTLSVSVFDGVATDTQDLVIEVANVNENPAFSQASFGLSTAEGVSGAVIGTPAFSVHDPDSGDSYTFSMDCGTYTSRFAMDRNTGHVTFQSDYDLDTGSLPTSVSCTVWVVDNGGLNSTATLDINIADENDNNPVFSPTAYSFYVSYYAQSGTTVGKVTANDNDFGTYGVLTYTLDQTALAEEHFSIDSTGLITVGVTPYGSAFGPAASVTLTVTASDIGARTDTASVVIIVSDTTTTSTTTTTDRYRKFLEDNSNIPWFVLCLITLVVIGVYLVWLVCTCRGRNGCATFKRNCFGRKNKSRTLKRTSYLEHSRPPPLPSPDFGRTVRKPPPPKEFQSWRVTD